MQQNAGIEISWGRWGLGAVASFLQLSTPPKTNLFLTFYYFFTSLVIYYFFFFFFFLLLFLIHILLLASVSSISTLPTFEFHLIFIFIFIFTFMSLSQYHFSASSISNKCHFSSSHF